MLTGSPARGFLPFPPMATIKNTTAAQRRPILRAIDHIQDQMKQHPTVSLIVKHTGLPNYETRVIISKMVREGLLVPTFNDRGEEFIYIK